MITIHDFWYSKGEQAFNFVYVDATKPMPAMRRIYTSFKGPVKGALAEMAAMFPSASIPEHYKTVTRPQITDL
jgi:hypothetical protein